MQEITIYEILIYKKYLLLFFIYLFKKKLKCKENGWERQYLYLFGVIYFSANVGIALLGFLEFCCHGGMKIEFTFRKIEKKYFRRKLIILSSFFSTVTIC